MHNRIGSTNYYFRLTNELSAGNILITLMMNKHCCMLHSWNGQVDGKQLWLQCCQSHHHILFPTCCWCRFPNVQTEMRC